MSLTGRIRARLEVESEGLDRLAIWLVSPAVRERRRPVKGKPDEVELTQLGASPLEFTEWCANGYPSGGGGPGPKGHVSDPTGNIVADRDEPRAKDQADTDMKATLRDLEQIGRLVAGIERRHHSYIPHDPTDRDRWESDDDAATCQSCSRVHVVSQPLTEQPTNVGGRLPDPKWLCRWCYEWVTKYGQLPSKKTITAHDQDVRILHRIEGNAVVIVAGGTRDVLERIPITRKTPEPAGHGA